MAGIILNSLESVNETNIADLLQKNFDDSRFYSNLGQCLLSMNPFPIYSFKHESMLIDPFVLQKYCNGESDANLPTTLLYKFGENINRACSDGTTSQAVLFRGCSGSGKSEALKSFLQYLICTDSSKNDIVLARGENVFEPIGTSRNPFQLASDSSKSVKAVAVASLLCDVMGTAATDKNKYSTRHFKLTKIYYSPENNRISGMKMKVFGTDLLRYGPKDPIHGNAYVLTLLLAGIGKRAEDYKLNSSMRDAYLSSTAVNYMNVDLAAEFNHLQHEVLSSRILSEEEWDCVLRALACVVNIQSLALVGSESTIISSSTKSYVANVETLLGLEGGTVGQLLLKRADDRIGKPAGSLVDNKPSESRAIADALSNAVFTRTFEYLLFQCSSKSFSDLHAYEKATKDYGTELSCAALHLVDMPGWERYDNGTAFLQQVLVNFSEEKFHALFVETVFVNEIERYAQEGVALGMVPYLNCTPYVELFDKPAVGLISSLEEASQSVRVDDKALLDKILLNNSKTEMKLVKAAGPKAKATAFIVKHSFGDVSYDCDGFVVVNKTVSLSAAALALLATSKIDFIARDCETGLVIGAPPVVAAPPAPAPGGEVPSKGPGVGNIKARGESKAALIANYFLTKNNNSLNALLAQLKNVSASHYVLCMSTVANKFEESSANGKLSISNMTNKTFNKEHVCAQIKHLQIESAVLMCKKGFPYVRSYYDFYTRFRSLQPFDMPALPYSIVDAYHSQDLTDVKLIELCKLLLQSVIASYKLTESLSATGLDYLPVYGKSSIFLKEVLSVTLEEIRFKNIAVSGAAAKKLQATFRMHKLFAQFRVMRKGVVVLQAIARCNLKRGAFLAQQFAANKLKSVYRMHRLFKWFRRMKHAVNLIKGKMLGAMIQRLRYKRLMKASRMFQNIARGYNIRKIASNTFDAVKILQRCAKSYLARKHYKERVLKATVMLQYLYRGYSVRKYNSSLVNVLKMRRQQRVATRVVKKIQSIWRGKLITTRYNEIVKATFTLQRWLISRLQRQKYCQLKRLALWLQSITRRLIAVNRANAARVANMVNEEKGILTELYTHELKSVQSIALGERSIGSGIHTAKGIINKYERYLALFDVNFDLNFAYPDGWCNSVIQFQRRLKSEKRSVAKIVIGAQHTLILDDLCNLYTMGLGDLGQLGHNNRQSFSQPKNIEKLAQYLSNTESVIASSNSGAKKGGVSGPFSMTNRVVVLDICCGRDHSMLLTGSGRVYSWGDNKRGQLGHSRYDSSPFPKLVGDEKLKRVKSICCGAYHSACIVEPGLLYTWGAAECLGRVSNDSHKYKLHHSATQGPSNTGGFGARSTNFSASTHTATDYNASFNLSDGSRLKDSCEPDVLPFFQKKRVLSACCGENHVAVKTATEFFSWGVNNQGQLGVGNTETSYIPVQLHMKPLGEQQMSEAVLFTGGRHMVLLVSGEIYLWGWNKYGQVGNGSIDNVLRPTHISLTNFAVSAGGAGANSHSSLNAKKAVGAKSAGSSAATPKKNPLQQEMHNEGGVTPKKNILKIAPKVKPQYIKSVNVGWRHVVVMTSSSQIFGWGMLNLANNNTAAGNTSEDAAGGSRTRRSSELYSGDTSLSTSDCFLHPTLLNSVLSVESYTANGTAGALLSLSGCSSSSLSIVSIDTELYTPLSGVVVEDRTRKPIATAVTTKETTDSFGTPKRLSQTNLLAFDEEHKHNTAPKAAAPPRFKQTFKATKLPSNPVFHIDHDEFKKRLKEELGTGISMGTTVNKSNVLINEPHSRNSTYLNTSSGQGCHGLSRSRSNSLQDPDAMRKRKSILKESGGNADNVVNYGDGVVDSPTRSLREREVPITSDDLVALFSPSYIKRIKSSRLNANKASNVEEADGNSPDSKGDKAKRKASYGVGMPKSEKAFLASFASRHSPQRVTQSNTHMNSMTTTSPTLSYSSRLATRRASMESGLLSSAESSTAFGFGKEPNVHKRLSFRSSTSDPHQLPGRRSSVDSSSVLNTHSHSQHSNQYQKHHLEFQSMQMRADQQSRDQQSPNRAQKTQQAAVPVVDYMGLDTTIDKLTMDLERMNSPAAGAPKKKFTPRGSVGSASSNEPIKQSGGVKLWENI